MWLLFPSPHNKQFGSLWQVLMQCSITQNLVAPLDLHVEVIPFDVSGRSSSGELLINNSRFFGCFLTPWAIWSLCCDAVRTFPPTAGYHPRLIRILLLFNILLYLFLLLKFFYLRACSFRAWVNVRVRERPSESATIYCNVRIYLQRFCSFVLCAHIASIWSIWCLIFLRIWYPFNPNFLNRGKSFGHSCWNTHHCGLYTAVRFPDRFNCSSCYFLYPLDLPFQDNIFSLIFFNHFIQILNFYLGLLHSAFYFCLVAKYYLYGCFKLCFVTGLSSMRRRSPATVASINFLP